MLSRYEKVGFVGKVSRFLWLPLVSVPLIGSFLFVRLSSLGRTMKRFAASYKALEIIYTYSWEKTAGKGMVERILTHILFNFMNAKAVRNRLRLVKQELERAILSLDKDEIHIMSLGSGSARAIIEVLAEMKNQNDGKKYTATLVDKSRSALEYGKILAKEKGVSESLTPVKGMLEEFVRNGQDYPPDIVEMVGILDYFDDDIAIEVVSEIYKLLPPGGILITCNVCDNSERMFLTHVLRWPMVYRGQRELCEILTRAGFTHPQVAFEPLGIHRLAIGRKITLDKNESMFYQGFLF